MLVQVELRTYLALLVVELLLLEEAERLLESLPQRGEGLVRSPHAPPPILPTARSTALTPRVPLAQPLRTENGGHGTRPWPDAPLSQPLRCHRTLVCALHPVPQWAALFFFTTFLSGPSQNCFRADLI